jgi:hypothetical protein
MGANVYADGDEIACKAGGGKVLASFPDVCLTPPPPPAGPVPVPYADTSFSRDMRNGSRTVKIGGKEVMLKDTSFYKSSPLGNEAATNGQGAGVVTHVITGKTYFVAWSMDVQFEGKNVDRHTDLTTSNHASPTPNAAVPNANFASVAPGSTIVLECDPNWTDCQKTQMKAKAARMDAIAKKKVGGLQTRGTVKLSAAKASWQKKFARDWNKPDPSGWYAFSNPSKQGGHFYDDCAKTDDPLGAGMQADHVHEVQLGGHVSGPFLWLDGAVNGASGRQILDARRSGITNPTGFTTKNC